MGNFAISYFWHLFWKQLPTDLISPDKIIATILSEKKNLDWKIKALTIASASFSLNFKKTYLEWKNLVLLNRFAWLRTKILGWKVFQSVSNLVQQLEKIFLLSNIIYVRTSKRYVNGKLPYSIYLLTLIWVSTYWYHLMFGIILALKSNAMYSREPNNYVDIKWLYWMVTLVI